jgi:NodT family efflux transporter outer membrane factor (OMF) lipoprotein
MTFLPRSFPTRNAPALPTAGLSLLLCLPLLAGCGAIGPDYERPPAPVPAQYKEIDGWKQGEPRPAGSDTAWWSIFNDPVLDALERQVNVNNQNVKSYEAAYRNSLALVQEARANYFPTVTASGTGERTGTGAHAASSKSSKAVYANSYSSSLSASWEIDVWGKIRRQVENAAATAQASAGDLAAIQLSSQGTLASDYFTLRAEDELKRILDATVEAYGQTAQITRNQYNQGVAALSDVTQAEAQLENARAQAVAVGAERSQMEHAIAVLIGKPPAEFSLAVVNDLATPPEIPVTVPSALLERRPDIAAAERQMAAANAEIGVAIGNYYPTVTLSASYEFANTLIQNLLQASSSLWSVGGTVSGTLLDGGLRDAEVEAARATYDEEVATYRQTVLSAFQTVEDELAAIRVYNDELAVQQRAVNSARQSVQLLINQYKAGTIAYTSVVTAQTTALTDEQTALTIRQNLLTASVSLVQALGGGWDASQLPAVAQDDKAKAEPVARE